MNSSFLYHGWGLYTLKCHCDEYKSKRIILHVTKKPEKCCPQYGKAQWVKNGYQFRDFTRLPIGGKQVYILALFAHSEWFGQSHSKVNNFIQKMNIVYKFMTYR